MTATVAAIATNVMDRVEQVGETTGQRFARLLSAHGAALSRLALAWSVDRADADDLSQEILFAIWRALPAFRGDCAERTFVFRVALNRAITHVRARRPTRSLDDTATVADPHPDPAAIAAANERRGRLLDAIRRLPATLRRTMVLHLEGLSNVEAAEVLGVSPNNVGVRLARGRALLRELLGEEYRE